MTKRWNCCLSSKYAKFLHMLWLSFLAGLVDASHVYSDIYPLNEEYDFTILDPDNVFGSPYGGFSRATTSRLAALPLKLPNIGEELTEFEEVYMEMRDSQGRKFVCRTFHEDELELDSLGDSMFDMPELRKENVQSKTASSTNIDVPESSADADGNTISTDEATTTDTSHSSETTNDDERGQDGEGKDHSDNILTDRSSKQVDKGSKSAENGIGAGFSSIGDSSSSSGSATLALTSIVSSSGAENEDNHELLREVDRRLSQLDGMCAHFHKGWWSYEWCHKEAITQFHVHIDGGSTKLSDVQLQDMTKLGKFTERKVRTVDSFMNDDDNLEVSTTTKGRQKHKSKSTKKSSNWIAGDQTELARVSDIFLDGDVCPDTGKPRITQVDFRCCSERVFDRHKGGVLHHGVPKATSLVAMLSFGEMDDKVCVYNATLCTPLLCDDSEKPFGQEEANKKNVLRTLESGSASYSSLIAQAPDLSIREILDLTFGKDHNTCIQSGTGGWWVYELCHGQHVRQFHETTLLDRLSGVASVEVDTEHILGKYHAEMHESYPKDVEWKYVVNATSPNAAEMSMNRKNPTTTVGGNGAYYEQEYTSGDKCEHPDVTDSAIKAGEFGEGGIERAASVRYSCGNQLDMTVKEDSTCHYIVDVSIPALCHHPIFKAPVSKRQIVKCLPAVTSSP